MINLQLHYNEVVGANEDDLVIDMNLKKIEVPMFSEPFLKEFVSNGFSFNIGNDRPEVTLNGRHIATTTKFTALLAKIELLRDLVGDETITVHVPDTGMLGKYLWRFLLGIEETKSVSINMVGYPIHRQREILKYAPIKNYWKGQKVQVQKSVSEEEAFVAGNAKKKVEEVPVEEEEIPQETVEAQEEKPVKKTVKKPVKKAAKPISEEKLSALTEKFNTK